MDLSKVCFEGAHAACSLFLVVEPDEDWRHLSSITGCHLTVVYVMILSIIGRNHDHETDKLYTTRLDLQRDFLRSKAKAK